MTIKELKLEIQRLLDQEENRIGEDFFISYLNYLANQPPNLDQDDPCL